MAHLPTRYNLAAADRGQRRVGIKELFSSAVRGRTRVQKHVRVSTNPYTQSPDRYNAMEQLLNDGSEDALVGLMKRFTITSAKSIEDEEEKGWVYRQLTDLGRGGKSDAAATAQQSSEQYRVRLLSAAKRFCLEHENIAWVLRVVEELANAREEWELIDALLARHPPGYERDPAKKIQLLTHVSEIDDKRVPDILIRYLEDPDEGVRFFVVEALVDLADERALEPLVQRLANAREDSLRVRTRVLDGLASLGWDVSAHKAVVVANLGHEHSFDGKKLVRR